MLLLLAPFLWNWRPRLIQQLWSVIAGEIMEDLQAALDQFTQIAADFRN
jgi:hypothetical protein